MFLRQAQFLEKNNDALHASLEGLVQESQDPFVRALFVPASSSSSEAPHHARRKLNYISIASKFKAQLQELMDKLASTVSAGQGPPPTRVPGRVRFVVAGAPSCTPVFRRGPTSFGASSRT